MTNKKESKLSLSRNEIEKSIKTLVKLFEIASDLQQYCGDPNSLDSYQRMAYDQEYEETANTLRRIDYLLTKHDYDLQKIFRIAIQPKLDAFATRRLIVLSELDKLPERVENWKQIVEEAELKFNS